MSSFLQDSCYKSTSTYCACIEFHFDEHRLRAFATNQLIEYTLEPNPDTGDDNGDRAPAQKLSIAFSTADVVVLGWRLGFLADYLRENKLGAVGILPKRYAELERTEVFVSAITITPVGKE